MNGIMLWAWMLWSCMHALATEMVTVVVFRAGRRVFMCLKYCEGQQKQPPGSRRCSYIFLKHRIADGTSTSRASKPSNVCQILRGPAKMGSGEDAIFAPLQADGANDKDSFSRSTRNRTEFLVTAPHFLGPKSR